MTRPIIAVTDSPFPSLDPVKAALARLDPESAWRRAPRPTTSSRSRATPTRSSSATPRSPPPIIGALTRCKVIGRTGLGVDNIDVPAAAARGIVVTYVPDYCLREVSDHAMALLLALARKIPFSTSWCSPAAGRCRRSRRCAGWKARCWA